MLRIIQCVVLDARSNGLVVMGLMGVVGYLGWFQAGPGYVDRWKTKPVVGIAGTDGRTLKVQCIR